MIYADSSNMDIEFMELLSANRTKKNCNTILLITHDNELSMTLSQRINQYLEDKNLFEHYQLVCVTKKDLNSLYESEDKVCWLDNYLFTVTELQI